MAFAVRREGSSLSITDQTSIEITPTTTNPQEKISSANPNQQPVDVEKQSKDAQDFASSRKSDLQLQTLFQQMSLNVRLTERTEAEKKETTPLDTESGRSFKSDFSVRERNLLNPRTQTYCYWTKSVFRASTERKSI